MIIEKKKIAVIIMILILFNNSLIIQFKMVFLKSITLICDNLIIKN